MVQAIINLNPKVSDFVEIFKAKKKIKNKNDAINKIIEEYSNLKINENEATEEFDLYEITKSLEKNKYFSNEKELEKYDIKL